MHFHKYMIVFEDTEKIIVIIAKKKYLSIPTHTYIHTQVSFESTKKLKRKKEKK
jgi:hypothetical protein